MASSASLPLVNGVREQSAALATQPSALLPLLMVVALYTMPLLVALRPVAEPIIDPDIWWHLRTGQWVVEHRAVPHTDPFSQYGAGRPWVAYSWLYEVLVYSLHAWLGLAGIILYRAGLALAVTAALHRLVWRAAVRDGNREANFLAVTGLTALGVLAIAPLFSERPWLFTILFTALTLDAILDLRAGQRTLLVWLLPVVYVLWASLHIQFVYGLFLLGLACLAPLIDHRLGIAQPSASDWRGPLLLTAACALATLVNPYHVGLYRVVLEYATQPGPFRFVNELKALEFREPSDWVVLALAGAAAFTLGRQRPLSSFAILLLTSTAFFAFRARRDLWFVVLAALAILSEHWGTTRNPVVRSASSSAALDWRHRLAAMGLVAGLAVLIACGRQLSPARLEEKVAGVFPVRAAAVVAERGEAGPLYNDFNWGGYLIWALPDLPVAIDGRTNLHGDERIVRFGNTWAGGQGWQDDPDLSAAGVVIAEARGPLAALLLRDGRFTLIHEDAVARVFVRARSENR
jgi:hypothetical protein